MTASTARPVPDDAPPVAARRAPQRLLTGDAAPVIFAVAVGALICAIGLTARSLGFDEGATVSIASQHGSALWHGIERDGGNMSAYYLLLHVVIGAFGDGPLVLALPSLVAASATAGLVAAIGLVWGDRRVAWVAGTLTAVCLPVVYWGQTARAYAPMLAFTCAGVLAFAHLVGATEHGRPGRRPAVAYAVAMILAAYCSFVAVLIVPAQLVVLARRRRALGRLVMALAGVAVACIPLAILAVRRGSGQLFWLPKPSGQVDTQVMQALTGTGLQSTFRRVPTTTIGWIVTSVVMLGLLAAVVRARRARVSEDPLGSFGPTAILTWAVLPGALAFVYSLASQPIFLSRNLLVCVPAFALGLALVICDPRLPRWAAGAALAAALAIRVVPVAAAEGVSPEPWRQATAAVLAQARPGDCVTFYPEDGHNAFAYYVDRAGAAARAPRSVLPAAGYSQRSPFVEIYDTLSRSRIQSLAAGCSRMWFITSHEGQRSGPAQSRAHLAAWQLLRVRLVRVFGHAPTVTYGYASAIHVQLLPGRRR